MGDITSSKIHQILSFKPLTRCEGGRLFPRGIYVTKDKPLPAIGESVEVSSLGSAVVFLGTVTAVDKKRRTYDAVVDLSNVKAEPAE